MSDVQIPAQGTLPAGDGGPAPAAAPTVQETQDVRALRSMADALVERGLIPRARADAELQRDIDAMNSGIDRPVLEVTPATPTDPFASAEVDSVFDRPATPAEYKFPPARSSESTLESMREVQELAWQARMPQPVAVQLFTMADDYLGRKLQPVDVELLKAQSWVTLRRWWGEQTDTKVALGQRFMSDLAQVNPKVMGLMDSGLGSDAGFVAQIVAHAERIYGGGRRA